MSGKFKYLNGFSYQTENVSNEVDSKVYILTSDGHRDSANLESCATDDLGLIKILIREALEIGQVVEESSVEIKHSRGGGWITYKYKDYGEDDLESGKWGFFALKVVK